MDPLKLFKLPLSYAGSHQFLNDFNKLNNNVSESFDTNMKYRIIFKTLNNFEIEVKLVLQEDQTIVLYKFKDKLITVPKLESNESLIERIIMSRNNEIYIIDTLNHQILLHKKTNFNKRGYISPLKLDNNFKVTNLNKFITFDIESMTNMDSVKNEGDSVYFDPIIISAYDFYHKLIFNKVLRKDLTRTDHIPLASDSSFNRNMRLSKIELLSEFFLQFLDKKYHKFVLYAHNMAKFDIVFIYESLLYLAENNNIKVNPIMRDNNLIKIRLYYYINNNKYYIDFHDSYQILNSSLENLSKTFLRDNPDLQKMNNKIILSLLLSENERIKYNNDIKLYKEFEKYCVRDVMALAYIIHNFNKEIYTKFKINMHRYPTISSLGLAIYLTKYLNNDSLIPLISGEIYKDISKAYHGGHTDVYELYSNEDVHSYDYSSMYPTQMLKHNMPVGKIEGFEGNILKTDNFQLLIDKLAFVKCSVYVDKSLNRPLYQTNVFLNGEMRSICATGTFLNQWVFAPELAKYCELTNGKIKIIPDSITKGYLFESKNIFKDYIQDLYDIKKSVDKSNPWYLISKSLMNCLYGRMGLKQEIVNYSFLNNNEIEKLTLLENNNIKDIIDFDLFDKKLVITENKNDLVSLKSSVSIAAAISAYARMELAPILLDPELDILYIDTDSYKSKQKIIELPNYKHLDHNELGALKYEGTFSESIFLLPKVYGGISKDSNQEITKIKGFKDNIEFNELKDLLFKNQSIKLTQNKWYRDMLKSEIKIMKTPYLLALNENKRINNLKTFKTKPYHFYNYKIKL
jgi:hypothetical protein